MSRETEKVMKQLMQYMEAHQDELGDGVAHFFDWAYRNLKKTSGTARTSK